MKGARVAADGRLLQRWHSGKLHWSTPARQPKTTPRLAVPSGGEAVLLTLPACGLGARRASLPQIGD